MIPASQIYKICSRTPRQILAFKSWKYEARSFSAITQAHCKEISKDVKTDVGPSFKTKAKEATKTTYYTLFVLAGIGMFGMMMYSVFSQLLSSFSPQSIYSKAVDKVIADEEVKERIGYPMKCFGESSRRGRRQRISHVAYEVDGQKGYRIQFHVQGSRTTGLVHLDAREASQGWDYRYLYVQEDSFPHKVMIIEDNRSRMDGSSQVSSFGVNGL